MKTRIIAVHLLNDFSGSPFVLRQALEACVNEGHDVHLFTATPSGNGFLNNINEVSVHPIPYKWSKNKWVTLAFFLYCQCVLFFRLLQLVRSEDTVYINSLLPFGAALAAKLKGCPVVYHVHEVSIQPLMLKKWLTAVMNFTASQCIYVSKYVQEKTAIQASGTVIYNALPDAFIQQAAEQNTAPANKFTVLMLCSLKGYKGIQEFVTCARQLPSFRFVLVLNAAPQEIEQFFTKQMLPSNLTWYPAQHNVHPFYQQASVVVNFSLPSQWIETFGMTILEAMYYKRPVIVPTVGGITELVDHGKNGYHIDSRDTNALVVTLQQLACQPSLYKRMSEAAFEKATRFSSLSFQQSILALISNLHKPKTNPAILIA